MRIRTAFTLAEFVTESNRIEGIGVASQEEITAHETLLALPMLTVPAIEGFVNVIAGAAIRGRRGMDVRVGNHRPPPGGREILGRLSDLLGQMPGMSPYRMHLEYETLHPFMDGNGRSGRAIWLYHMGGIRRAPLGFLHHFYYQALQGERR